MFAICLFAAEDALSRLRTRQPRMRWIIPLAIVASLGVGTLAKHIAEPERTPHTNLKIEAVIGLPRETHTTAEGVRLSYLLVSPAKRNFRYEIARTDSNGLRFDMKVKNVQATVPTRGSIIYMHGWSSNGDQFTPWALGLAEHGYAGVVVDLRGHGDSADAPAGYGPSEARDIADLVRALLAEGRIQAPVFLMGASYGGATSLFTEPALRDVLSGIVAFAPFASAEDGIHGAIDEVRNSKASGISARITLAALRRMDEADIDAAIRQAGQQLGIDLHKIDARPLVATSQTCTLLLHGADDRVFAPSQSQTLAASNPMVAATVVPGHGHVDLPLRIDWLTISVSDWMTASAQRKDGECPAFGLPADPLTSGN